MPKNDAPTIVRDLPTLRQIVRGWRADGQTIGVVPTMGALHPGHLSLVTAATTKADRVIVTLFVNPKQFDNQADLKAYPRTEADDAVKLASSGADILYAPDAETIYPAGFSTQVSVSGLTDGLCAGFRPGHFDGMATVVTKLLTQTAADYAFFGEKDFQQLRIVQRLARDLDIPVKIIGCATVREESGLALSSRNTRLSYASRQTANVLYAVLQDAATQIVADNAVEATLRSAHARILEAGFATVEYLEMRDADDLSPLDTLRVPARLLVAAWIDGVRLIDNVAVG